MDFATQLDRLAQLAVRVGLNVQAGQELVATAPIEALPLTRLITKHAYSAGASLVTFLFTDDDNTLARYQHASDASFDKAAAWLFDGMANAFEQGAARLAVSGANPTLLKGQDPSRIARAAKAQSMAYQRALSLITSFHMNWSIVAYASPSWAKQVFPQMPEEQAVGALWQAIFKACRVDRPDWEAAWQQHNQNLAFRREYLNQKNYAALHFRGPGTDLMLGLAEGHKWAGGADKAKNGVVCNPNLPTEEVFTTPHARKVEGYVSSSKPFAYRGGAILEGIWLRFEGGKVVEAKAKSGEETLHKLLATDPGASRLGEVALVPHSSPISQTGILFYNTLFDENAASHLALGQAYYDCMHGGSSASPEELAARGANQSMVHEDWMIGSAEMEVDGIGQSGEREPLMRGGEWVS